MNTTTAAKRKGPISAPTLRTLASHPEVLTNQKEALMSQYTNVDESTTTKPAYLDVLCTRDHCDRQGKMHRLDMMMYETEDEARELVSHAIDLGGVFHVDCIGAEGAWSLWTNHNEIWPHEIAWWIEQADAAAKLCMDLNKQATA